MPLKGYSVVVVSPRRAGSKEENPTKNQKYPIKMVAILKGMKCIIDIAPCLVKMKYEDHDFLSFTDFTAYPLKDRTRLEEDPIVRTSHEWELGLDKLGLLGLIHMPHFA